MVDVAELGISFTSKGAAQAEREIENIKRAGAGLEAQYKAIDKAAGGLSDKEAQTVKSLQNKILATQLSSRELAVHNALLKSSADASSVAGGAIAELARVSDDLSKKQSQANDSGSNLANTLTRRFVLGFIVSQIKSMVSALFELSSALEKVSDVAQRAGASSQSLQGLQAAFGYKGGDTAAFVDQFLKFSQEVDKAKRGVGDLAALFRLNGQAISDSTSTFLRVADLVKQTTNEADKFRILQEAGLPPTREMVKLMEQGSAAIMQQANAAQKFSDAQLENQKAVKEKYDQFIVDWTQKFKSAWVSVTEFIGSSSITKGLTGNTSQFSRAPIAADPGFDKPFLGSAPPKPKTKEETVEEITRAQQYLALLGQTATAEEAVYQVELQRRRAAVDGITIDSRRAELLKQMAEDQSLGVAQMKASADALTIEAATTNMATVAAEEYRAVQTAILENRRRGIDLTSEANKSELDYIRQQAAELGTRKAEAEAAKTIKEFNAADPLKSLQLELSNLDDQLARGKLSWEAYEFASTRATANTVAGVLSMTGSLATNLGKLFNNNKAFLIAGAIMDTAAGVAKAIGSGVPPWNFIQAAAVAAAGAAQIATIRSTQPGSGGGSVSTPSSAPAAVSAAPAAVPDVPQRSVYVNIQGKNFSEDHLKELIDAINDHAKDGGTRIQVV